MNALLPAHRRAERFAALVDATSTPGADERYAPLLEVVGTLRTAAGQAPAPGADYVADLRSRLMAEADTALVPTDSRLVLPQRHTPHRRQNRFTAAAAGLVLAGSTAGIAVAAQGSLPGEGFYPVKRGLEQVGQALSFTDAGRGRDLLGQAGSRLDEVDALLARGGSDTEISATLHSFRTSAGDGGDLLFRTYQRDGDDGSVSAVRDFAGTAMGRLTQLAHEAPASLRPDFADAAQVVADLDQQATVLCAECGRRDALRLPSDLRLASAEATLLDLLDVAPPITGTGDATGTGPPGTDTSTTGAAGAPVSTGTPGAITLPPLEDLLGTPGGTSPGTTTPEPGTPDNPLGSVLPVPSVGTSGVPGVGDVTKKATDKVKDTLKKDLGKITDPIVKP